MSWASLATELLWTNALAVVPLAMLVAVTCRWIPCRPTTRHSLWLVVLLWFVVPPLLPELHASASRGSEKPVLVATQPQPASIGRYLSNRGTRRSARPIFDVPAPVVRPTAELRETWPRRARAMPPTVASGTRATTPRPSEILPRVRHVTEAAGAVTPARESSRWQVFPSILAVRDAVGRLPSIPASPWLFGVAIVVFARLIQVIAFRRMMRLARPASGDVIDAVAAASGQIGLRRVPETLMMGDGADGRGGLSPFVWCGFRTQLVLPAGLWSRLDEPGRQSVILHELAHIARRDHWVCRLTWAVCCVYWWHPVAWWVRGRLREEADYCCDGWVTWLMPRGRRAYAEALLTTKQYISLPRFPIPELAIGALTDGAKRFGTRIRFIMTQTVAPRISVLGMGMVFLLAVVGWAATPARSSPGEMKGARAPRSDVVIPAVYVPAASATFVERARHGFAKSLQPTTDEDSLEARLLFLERRIADLSAILSRLAATVTDRGDARPSRFATVEPIPCAACLASEISLTQASKSLRRQIEAIGARSRGIGKKAANWRDRSHRLRITAKQAARRATERRSRAGSDDFEGVIEALTFLSEARAMKARAEAVDAQAALFRSQVRLLERCALQLESDAETLDRVQVGLDEQVAPLRDWAMADEPDRARRRM